MARQKKTETTRPIETYEHSDKKRVNNPPVGLVTPDTDPDAGTKKTYAYDPHLDPQLQWAGKAEHTSFAVPTVSLHVHERIDPRTIIEAVQQRQHGREVPAAATAGQHALVERSFAIGTGELVLHGNLAGQAAVKAISEAPNQGV